MTGVLSALIISVTDAGQESLARANWPLMQAWADRHGWRTDFRIVPPCSDRGPFSRYYVKWLALADAPNGGLCLWLDADCVVQRPEAALPDMDRPLAFSQDRLGLCCGAFAGRATVIRALARSVLDLGPANDTRTGDQDRVKELVPQPDLWPESFISNPESSPADRAAAWAHHAWANGLTSYQDDGAAA